jgi:hypothetical protein
MRIAVMSDTHDHIWKLKQALELIRQEGAGAVLHCGDLCSPFMIRHLGEGSEVPIHLVWGNNEGDPRMIAEVASRYPHVHLHGQLARLELGGVRIAVNHYLEIAEPLALSGLFDLVCYGHDHKAFAERRADCWLLNPGEVLGMNGRSTIAWFDTETGRIHHEELS